MPYLERISRKAEKGRRASSKQTGPVYLKWDKENFLSHLTFTFGWHLNWPCVFGSSSLEPSVSTYACSEGTLHPGMQFPNTRNLHWIYSLVICKHGCAIIHLNKLYFGEIEAFIQLEKTEGSCKWPYSLSSIPHTVLGSAK